MCIDRKIERERERGRGGSEWGKGGGGCVCGMEVGYYFVIKWVVFGGIVILG